MLGFNDAAAQGAAEGEFRLVVALASRSGFNDAAAQGAAEGNRYISEVAAFNVL